MADEIRIVDPTSPPISLDDVKACLRITDHLRDWELDNVYLPAAVKRCEDRIGQQFMPATWRKSFDGFPLWLIMLPRPPAQSITSITYLDINGNTQTVDPSIYLLDSDSRPARLTPAYNQVWPPFRFQINCVSITWQAGYADAMHVPATTKAAIAMMTGFMNENRDIDAEMPRAVEELLLLEWHGRGTPNQMAYGYGFV